ncbi:hypothetical protein DOY81_004048, partial [Sarcophaga bullata]
YVVTAASAGTLQLITFCVVFEVCIFSGASGLSFVFSLGFKAGLGVTLRPLKPNFFFGNKRTLVSSQMVEFVKYLCSSCISIVISAKWRARSIVGPSPADFLAVASVTFLILNSISRTLSAKV